MPCRKSVFVLGLGLGALLTPVWEITARYLAGESLLYPKESPDGWLH